MCNFRVGQKVVPVGLDPSYKSPVLVSKQEAARKSANIPVRGQVYTIRAIYNWAHGSTLLLDEFCNRHLIGWKGATIEPGFPAWGFRPVVERKTDISIFRAMLNTAPEKAGAA